MLNFRNTFAVFFFAVGTGNLLRFVFGINVPDYYYWLVGLLTIAAVAYGSSNICSGFHFTVMCKGQPSHNKKLTLTFDDGIDPVQTPQILDLLKKYDIRAAFFLVGSKCTGNEPLIMRMLEEGHIIGNHSWSHSHWFDLFSSAKMYAEIKQTDHLLEEISGKKVRFFRPPYGVTNPMLKKALEKSGHLAVGWSIRSFDTSKNKSDSHIIQRVTSRMQSGDIILFHDSSNKILNIVETVINFGIDNGFTFIGLDQQINENAYYE